MKRMVMDGDPPFLPQEIIGNILKRLPVKSLIRIQCVCKHWKNLIKTPSFVEEHLHASLQNPLLILQNPYTSLLLFLDRKLQAREVEDIPFYSMRPRLIIGSSHGLLCVETRHSILLWNPAIREVRQVPIGASKEFEVDYYFGFGFSSIVNDFKLVRILVSDIDDLVKQVEVYSLNTGSWKEIDFDFEDKAPYFEAVTANGMMFWRLSKRGFTEDVYLILSFDITKEVFTWMSLPALESYPRLTVYDNKLALLSCSRTGDTDLWVMEECTSAPRERWSWSKKHTICLGFTSPLGIWWNDMVYNVYEGHVKDIRPETALSLVNLNTHEIKKFAIPECVFNLSVAFSYVESLVSVGNIRIEEPSS